jgi:hypothetical protein
MSPHAPRRGGMLEVVLILLVQFGNAHLRDAGGGNPLAPLIGAVVGGCAAAVLVLSLGLAVPRLRRAVRSWRRRRRRLLEAAHTERRARAQMSELCPHGWRALITIAEPMHRGGHANGTDARLNVALEWTEFEDEEGGEAISRRVWAPTIAEALDAMVADRRTDETLEQIERAAAADDASWSEP